MITKAIVKWAREIRVASTVAVIISETSQKITEEFEIQTAVAGGSLKSIYKKIRI